MIERPVVPIVIEQHAQELTALWSARDILCRQGHVALRHVARFDERIAAHVDGCEVAGSSAGEALARQLVEPTAAALFAAAVVALARSDRTAVGRCLQTAEAVPESAGGLLSAMGWVSRDRLAGIGRDLLVAEAPFRRRLGLAACRLQRVDAAQALVAGLRDAEPALRAEALRTAGDLGRQDLLRTIAEASGDSDPECAFRGARSAVLLGDRNVAVHVLVGIGLAPGPRRTRALRLALQASSVGNAHAVLQRLAEDEDDVRCLIEGSGIVGDPTYVPWLIGLMADKKVARLAGQAFSVITGADLAWLDLERTPPANAAGGPTDNPEDDNVDVDPDEGLPWPDHGRVQRWWDANGGRFQPGTRYFVGAPLSREHCLDVLRNGYQRQRILAAHYLCLLQPGTPLFNTSAPAWRQQRWLAQME